MRRFTRVTVYPAMDDGNPYLRLFYQAARQENIVVVPPGDSSHFDILHVHWPDLPLASRYLPAAVKRSATLMRRVARARAQGAKVVWTIHNAASHERWYPRLERLLFKWFTSQVDAVTGLSATGLCVADELYPALRELPRAVTPHGPFDTAYGEAPPRMEARQRLGLPADAEVVLHFGHLRPYKGSVQLAAAFRRLPGEDRRLIIAGRARPHAMESALRDAADRDKRVVRLSGRVPDSDVVTLLAAADLLALPYRHILHSGAAILGLSYARPVIVPALGALPELARSQPPGWVRLYQGEVSAPVVEAALADKPDASTRPQLPSWSVGASQFAALLHETLNR
jgi:beta-1,4-mannosyltransferase